MLDNRRFSRRFCQRLAIIRSRMDGRLSVMGIYPCLGEEKNEDMNAMSEREAKEVMMYISTRASVESC